jgi:cytochrome P450
MLVLVQSIIGGILAGVFNTSINASWNLCYLAQSPIWMAKLRAEVDGATAKHRRQPEESVVGILHRFTLGDWETEFPLLELAMKETMRFTMSGTIVRRNIGGRKVPVGDTGTFIPPDGLAVRDDMR